MPELSLASVVGKRTFFSIVIATLRTHTTLRRLLLSFAGVVYVFRRRMKRSLLGAFANLRKKRLLA